MADATPKIPTYRALRITLRAALDPNISTEALRVYLGIAGTVWSRRAKDDGVAYLDRDLVENLSGVTHRTFQAPEHRKGLIRLGVEQVSQGEPRSEIDGHGIAGTWDVCESTFTPLTVAGLPHNQSLPSVLYLPRGTVDIEELTWVVGQSRNASKAMDGISRLLDPQSRKWMQDQGASSGWRLACVLVALFGLKPTTVNAAELALVMGRNRSSVTRAFQNLEGLHLVKKSGRSWTWDTQMLLLEIASQTRPGKANPDAYYLDNRPARAGISRRPAWLESRTKRVEEFAPAWTAPLPYGRPLTPDDVSSALAKRNGRNRAFADTGLT